MDPLGLQTHLRPDEQLLWYGAPDPRVWFAPVDAFLVPFGILWCSFVMFGWSSVVSHGGGPFEVLSGIPFIVIGLYMLVGRFVYKRYRKTRTTYGITTQRAMIIGPTVFADIPLRGQPVTIGRSRDSRHASVIIGDTVLPVRRPGRVQVSSSFYANTGLEPFARNVGLPFSFYDVAEPDAMLRALEQARAHWAA
jgi:hypothetical protein